MLNIFSLVCIHINSTLYSSSFLLAKLPEAYAFFNPIVDIMPVFLLLFALFLPRHYNCSIGISVSRVLSK
ncbi:hypothetical protein AHAS_Ahas19G0227300 [Arachis hypogaea]|uniref:Uncharacterized protein n=1 Tax=Arachis hypogaea TaxID=3818 RepID=A0A444XQ50_ARAHY|nr:hypothetical protein Ahy_B09g097833 [Arachis hypogaea]